MNYNTIAKFIKQRRSLIIWDTDAEQWIGDGVGFYPIFNMPKMSESEIITFLGLEKDYNNNKIVVSRTRAPQKISFGDCDPDENMLNVQGPAILYLGELCRTYYTEQGAIACYNKYINVVERDAADEEFVTPYLRLADGLPYIAMINGFELSGICLTATTISKKKFAKEYEDLAAALKLAYENFGRKDSGNESEE